MSEGTDSETELYGVSPRVIGLFMLIVTILAPIGFVSTNGYIVLLISVLESPFLYGLLWVENLSYSPFYGFSFFNLQYMWAIVPLSIFSILFLRQIVRYYQGKSSRDSVLVAGFLSLLFPPLVGLIQTRPALDISEVTIVIPIPIQFIIGLIILHKIEGPELISPWHGQSIDWSFWKRPRATWPNRSADADETIPEEEHDDSNSPRTDDN